MIVSPPDTSGPMVRPFAGGVGRSDPTRVGTVARAGREGPPIGSPGPQAEGTGPARHFDPARRPRALAELPFPGAIRARETRAVRRAERAHG